MSDDIPKLRMKLKKSLVDWAAQKYPHVPKAAIEKVAEHYINALEKINTAIMDDIAQMNTIDNIIEAEMGGVLSMKKS